MNILQVANDNIGWVLCFYNLAAIAVLYLILGST